MADNSRDKPKAKPDDDVMHGRSFAGASYGANEREQTRERERVADNVDEVDEIVTDAELDESEATPTDDDVTP
jgi:hypothetical protein